MVRRVVAPNIDVAVRVTPVPSTVPSDPLCVFDLQKVLNRKRGLIRAIELRFSNYKFNIFHYKTNIVQ